MNQPCAEIAPRPLSSQRIFAAAEEGGSGNCSVPHAVRHASRIALQSGAKLGLLHLGRELDGLLLSTDGGGIARADFHAPRRPETATVRATSNALSAEVDVETALVDPDRPAGHVTSYPNPFHPGEAPATIAYKLSAEARVTLTFFTLLGTEVRREEIPVGSPGGREGLNEFLWDGRNGKGEIVASGGYILVIEAVGDGETLHKMHRRVAVVR